MKMIAVAVALTLVSVSAVAFETPTQECVNGLADNPKVQQLRSRAPIRFAEQTFATLTNVTKASADDQTIISQWAELVEYCHNGIADSVKTLPQPAIQILERDHTQFLILLADLYGGNLTFGDFAKRRAELNSITTSQIMSLADERQRARDQQVQLRAQAAAQEAAQTNQAARNAAIGILMGRALAPAPAYIPIQPYVIPRPAITNCQSNGLGGTTCTTR